MTDRRRVVKARRAPRQSPPATAAGPSIAREFTKYCSDEEPGVIGPEGVERLCADLGLADVTDRRVLLLAWKAGAERQGYFSQTELCRAGAALRAPTLPALAAALTPLADAVDKDAAALADMFGYAFKFCLTEERRRILDIATARALLGVVLPPTNPHTKPLLAFMEAQTEAKSVTADTWGGIARFITTIDGPCESYDEGDAWPLLLDNYVAWVRTRVGKATG